MVLGEKVAAGILIWTAAVNDLYLLIISERTCEDYFDIGNFQTHLFSQFAADGIFGLFCWKDESARNAPAFTGSKAMLKQQHTPDLVNHDCARCHREARFGQQNAPSPDSFRQMPPQLAEQINQLQIRGPGLVGAFDFVG